MSSCICHYSFPFKIDKDFIWFFKCPFFIKTPIYSLLIFIYMNVFHELHTILISNFAFFISFQIGSLKNYYLFHHRHVSKRSVSHNEEHHRTLKSEPEVRISFCIIQIWFTIDSTAIKQIRMDKKTFPNQYLSKR